MDISASDFSRGDVPDLSGSWLQQQIWEDPATIGLGNLTRVSMERDIEDDRVNDCLDILLKDPSDDSIYDVQFAVGDTDSCQVIRTIETWNLVKRKWLQRQHYAVIITQRMTSRLLNVMKVLSVSIPIIAIQVDVINSPAGKTLQFRKILEPGSDNAAG